MDKRSIFLIIFSIIGIVALSIMESIKTNTVIQWVVVIIYVVVIFITMYLPTKKEKKKNKK